jgi:hypothetical protein
MEARWKRLTVHIVASIVALFTCMGVWGSNHARPPPMTRLRALEREQGQESRFGETTDGTSTLG